MPGRDTALRHPALDRRARLGGAPGLGHGTGNRCRHGPNGRHRPRRSGRVRAALDLLSRIPSNQVSPAAAAYAALYRGLTLRSLGREGDARVELGKASIDGRLLPDASSALADSTYGPVVTTAEAIAARTSRWDPRSGPSTDELRHVEQAKAAQAVLEEADRDLNRI